MARKNWGVKWCQDLDQPVEEVEEQARLIMQGTTAGRTGPWKQRGKWAPERRPGGGETRNMTSGLGEGQMVPVTGTKTMT